MNHVKHLALPALFVAVIGCSKSATQLTDDLKSANSPTRLHAVHALQEKQKDVQVAVPALVGALEDEDPFVRRDAARALGKFGGAAREAVPALVAHLQDREPGVRKAATQALQKIDPAAVAAR
jgi:HEAT repeat protein